MDECTLLSDVATSIGVFLCEMKSLTWIIVTQIWGFHMCDCMGLSRHLSRWTMCVKIAFASKIHGNSSHNVLPPPTNWTLFETPNFPSNCFLVDEWFLPYINLTQLIHLQLKILQTSSQHLPIYTWNLKLGDNWNTYMESSHVFCIGSSCEGFDCNHLHEHQWCLFWWKWIFFMFLYIGSSCLHQPSYFWTLSDN